MEVYLTDSFLTSDTKSALSDALKMIRSVRPVFSVIYSGSPNSIKNWEDLNLDRGPTGMPPHCSMRNTGREVYVRIDSDNESRPVMISELWSALVPRGFVPWDRYPNPSGTDSVFHYFGDWYSIGDSLQGEGMGEHSWPSMCVASQLDAGVWEGSRPTERSVQSHLHRIGIPCGPVDGVINDRVLRALKSLGMSGMSLEETLQRLKNTETIRHKQGEKRVGQLFIDETKMRVFCSGAVQSKRTKSGIVLSSWGPGILNVILDE